MNRERWQRVIEQIEAHPEQWDQQSWHSPCGTKHCLAGWAQIVSGKAIQSGDAAQDAMDYLELDAYEAAYLFSPARTLQELGAYADDKGEEEDPGGQRGREGKEAR